MKRILKNIVTSVLAACMIAGTILFAGCATDRNACIQENTPATAEQEQIYNLGEIKFDSLVPLSNDLVVDSDFMDTEYEPQVIGINATISGYKGEKPELEWYLEWGEGKWKAGKTITNYITVETFAGTNTEAAVICHRPFLTDIYVYARVKTQPNVKAVCIVSYGGAI